ncbi:MAG: ACT domain-containing protein [Alicyclobacillus sp.]|nr:ACT domain-containing protein [Alicyclobacillus sp.]
MYLVGEQMDDPYYLIPRSHLPEAIRRVTEVAELLERNPRLRVTEAVQRVGISRSVYYKYKDVVRPFQSAVRNRVVTLSLTLFHVPGALASVLEAFAQARANLLTVHQSIPLQGLATVVITTETRGMSRSVAELLQALQNLDGVRDAFIVGEEFAGGAGDIGIEQTISGPDRPNEAEGER